MYYSKNKQRKIKIIWSQFILRLFLLFAFLGLIWGGYVLFKINSFEKQGIEIRSSNHNPSVVSTLQRFFDKKTDLLKGENRNRINILLLGMGGEGHKGRYLTDTIILASINPKNYETALISIPRDLYVEIPNSNVHTKINAVYAYEKRNSQDQGNSIHSVEKVVENITGQSIDYYLSMNFTGFKKVIDELGGIIIQVEEDIVDNRYPGPGTSYETFKIDKGAHLVNGDVALKYARVRHTAGGDFARLKRQQEIISAAKRRALSLGNFINPVKLTNLLEILGENIQTNIQLNEIPAFIKIFNNINTYEMNATVLDAWSSDSLLAVSHVFLGGIRAFVLIPRTGNYQEIHGLVENIFDLNKLQKNREEILKEAAKIVLVREKYGNSNKIKNIFKKIGYKISIETDSLMTKNCQTKTKILTSNKNKFFTLTDLSNKFNADIVRGIQNEYSADIVLCFPSEKLKILESQVEQSNIDEFDGGTILDDDGNILYNEN